MLRLLLFGWLAAILHAAEPACEGAVVYRSGSDAYTEAVNGIRESVDGSCRVEYVDLAEVGAEGRLAAVLKSNRLIAAVGVGAWERVKNSPLEQNLLPALVLRADMRTGYRGSAVYADVPLSPIVDHLHRLFPNKRKLAVIYRPGWPGLDSSVLARVRQAGYELLLVECTGPEKLLQAFSSLKGKVDFVIALPDAELYNSATVKPLVLASLEQRLPIVGFSAAFVRAGALVGVYPNFRELGRETGGLILKLSTGRGVAAEDGVHLTLAGINQRIARLLGMEASRLDGVDIIK